MNRAIGAVIGFALLLGACSPKQVNGIVYKFTPLNEESAQKIRERLGRGDLPKPGEETPISAPAEPEVSFTGNDTLDLIICKKQMQDELKMKFGSDLFFNFIHVPENPDEPNGRQIRVFYYGRLSSGATPVVHYNGGPMADSHSNFALFEKIRAGTAKSPELIQVSKLDVIYIDQRGTGCSDPYPTAKTVDDALRRRFYGAKEIVADSEAIRSKLLGEKKWKVYGQSYGGKIVQLYLMLHPEGIEEAFAHGFTPQYFDNELETDVERILSQRDILDEMDKVNPGTKASLLSVKKKLNDQNICLVSEVNPENKICGDLILSIFAGQVGFSNTWASISQFAFYMDLGETPNPKLLKQLAQYYFAADEAAVSSRPKKEDDESEKSYGNLAYLAYLWTDGTDYGNFVYSCPKIMAELKKRNESLETAAFHECQRVDEIESTALEKFAAYVEGVYSELAATFQREPLSTGRLKKSLEASHVPFHLYSGALDTFVPARSFPNSVKELGDTVKYVNFENTGHDGYFAEKRVWLELAGITSPADAAAH